MATLKVGDLVHDTIRNREGVVTSSSDKGTHSAITTVIAGIGIVAYTISHIGSHPELVSNWERLEKNAPGVYNALRGVAGRDHTLVYSVGSTASQTNYQVTLGRLADRAKDLLERDPKFKAVLNSIVTGNANPEVVSDVFGIIAQHVCFDPATFSKLDLPKQQQLTEAVIQVRNKLCEGYGLAAPATLSQQGRPYGLSGNVKTAEQITLETRIRETLYGNVEDNAAKAQRWGSSIANEATDAASAENLAARIKAFHTKKLAEAVENDNLNIIRKNSKPVPKEESPIAGRRKDRPKKLRKGRRKTPQINSEEIERIRANYDYRELVEKTASRVNDVYAESRTAEEAIKKLRERGIDGSVAPFAADEDVANEVSRRLLVRKGKKTSADTGRRARQRRGRVNGKTYLEVVDESGKTRRYPIEVGVEGSAKPKVRPPSEDEVRGFFEGAMSYKEELLKFRDVTIPGIVDPAIETQRLFYLLGNHDILTDATNSNSLTVAQDALLKIAQGRKHAEAYGFTSLVEAIDLVTGSMNEEQLATKLAKQAGKFDWEAMRASLEPYKDKMATYAKLVKQGRIEAAEAYLAGIPDDFKSYFNEVEAIINRVPGISEAKAVAISMHPANLAKYAEEARNRIHVGSLVVREEAEARLGKPHIDKGLEQVEDLARETFENHEPLFHTDKAEPMDEFVWGLGKRRIAVEGPAEKSSGFRLRTIRPAELATTSPGKVLGYSLVDATPAVFMEHPTGHAIETMGPIRSPLDRLDTIESKATSYIYGPQSKINADAIVPLADPPGMTLGELLADHPGMTLGELLADHPGMTLGELLADHPGMTLGELLENLRGRREEVSPIWGEITDPGLSRGEMADIRRALRAAGSDGANISQDEVIARAIMDSTQTGSVPRRLKDVLQEVKISAIPTRDKIIRESTEFHEVMARRVVRALGKDPTEQAIEALLDGGNFDFLSFQDKQKVRLIVPNLVTLESPVRILSESGKEIDVTQRISGGSNVSIDTIERLIDEARDSKAAENEGGAVLGYIDKRNKALELKQLLEGGKPIGGKKLAKYVKALDIDVSVVKSTTEYQRDAARLEHLKDIMESVPFSREEQELVQKINNVRTVVEKTGDKVLVAHMNKLESKLAASREASIGRVAGVYQEEASQIEQGLVRQKRDYISRAVNSRIEQLNLDIDRRIDRIAGGPVDMSVEESSTALAMWNDQFAGRVLDPKSNIPDLAWKAVDPRSDYKTRTEARQILLDQMVDVDNVRIAVQTEAGIENMPVSEYSRRIYQGVSTGQGATSVEGRSLVLPVNRPGPVQARQTDKRIFLDIESQIDSGDLNFGQDGFHRARAKIYDVSVLEEGRSYSTEELKTRWGKALGVRDSAEGLKALEAESRILSETLTKIEASPDAAISIHFAKFDPTQLVGRARELANIGANAPDDSPLKAMGDVADRLQQVFNERVIEDTQQMAVAKDNWASSALQRVRSIFGIDPNLAAHRAAEDTMVSQSVQPILQKENQGFFKELAQGDIIAGSGELRRVVGTTNKSISYETLNLFNTTEVLSTETVNRLSSDAVAAWLKEQNSYIATDMAQAVKEQSAVRARKLIDFAGLGVLTDTTLNEQFARALASVGLDPNLHINTMRQFTEGMDTSRGQNFLRMYMSVLDETFAKDGSTIIGEGSFVNLSGVIPGAATTYIPADPTKAGLIVDNIYTNLKHKAGETAQESIFEQLQKSAASSIESAQNLEKRYPELVGFTDRIRVDEEERLNAYKQNTVNNTRAQRALSGIEDSLEESLGSDWKALVGSGKVNPEIRDAVLAQGGYGFNRESLGGVMGTDYDPVNAGQVAEEAMNRISGNVNQRDTYNRILRLSEKEAAERRRLGLGLETMGEEIDIAAGLTKSDANTVNRLVNQQRGLRAEIQTTIGGRGGVFNAEAAAQLGWEQGKHESNMVLFHMTPKLEETADGFVASPRTVADITTQEEWRKGVFDPRITGEMRDMAFSAKEMESSQLENVGIRTMKRVAAAAAADSAMSMKSKLLVGGTLGLGLGIIAAVGAFSHRNRPDEEFEGQRYIEGPGVADLPPVGLSNTKVVVEAYDRNGTDVSKVQKILGTFGKGTPDVRVTDGRREVDKKYVEGLIDEYRKKV